METASTIRILVVDTETDGLFRKGKRPRDPHIVQLCYVVAEFDPTKREGRIIKVFDSLIKMPEGETIDSKATAIHGITTERANEDGVDLKSVYEPFFDEMESADLLVAHNTEFDFALIKVELQRMIDYNEADYSLRRYPKKIKADRLHRMMQILENPAGLYCTMKESKDICRIPNPYLEYFGDPYKFPRLSETCQELFGFEPIHLHDAYTDVLVCLMCFFKMKYDYDWVDGEKDEDILQRFAALRG